MANHQCIDGKLDGVNYSSPVPVVGLYIAAASLVCMLLMLNDIAAGLRAGKRWLPCKLFTLNSVTLTLLSIATKLPVDLTTPMPSPQDQLSKLSGTALICISMGFLMPSLGVNNDTESFTNMVSMTIFVITTFVNICIQISTGVIVLFIAEHIIILCCMLLLLMTLWFSSWDIRGKKKNFSDQNKGYFTKKKGSMFNRLKLCYLCGYCTNPQYVMCMHPICDVVGTICLMCSVVLIQATFRSLILKQLVFCSGNSDYEWSMWMIVVTQVLSVVIGNFATFFRWVTLFGHREYDQIFKDYDETHDVIEMSPILGMVSTLNRFRKFYVFMYMAPVFVVQLLIIIPSVLLLRFLGLFDKRRNVSFDDLTEGDHSIWFDGYITQRSVEEMNRLTKECKSKSSNHLVQLLSHTSSSQQLHPMEVKDPTFPNQEGIKVSSLSIVLLVRIAQVSIPDTHSESLVQTFKETKEVIHFIDKTISTKSFENNDKLLFAKAVWKGPDFSCLLPRIFASACEPSSDLDRAVVIITNLKRVLPLDLVRRELGYIMEFINLRTYSSIEDLYTFIEQLFVDMLHTLLTQLPVAIFKLLTESPVEEFEKRATLAFKLLCKFESLDGRVQWSYPVGCNISRLVGSEAPATRCSMESLEEGIDLITTDGNNHGLAIHDDVITVV